MASESCGGGAKPCAWPDHAIHWTDKDIGDPELRVLRWVKRGTAPSRRDAFAVAYLIAIGCLDFDRETTVVTMTDKGLCCLDWEGRPDA